MRCAAIKEVKQYRANHGKNNDAGYMFYHGDDLDEDARWS
jgi:hypothetical protein